MNPVLRFTIVACALIVLLFVMHRLRTSKINTSDSLFWLFLCVCLLIIAIFPGIAYFFSNLFGFQSPSNLIFVAVIGLLLIREFSIQNELSELRSKITQLSQEVALNNRHDQNNEADS